MTEVNGWHLPTEDSYFSKYAEAPKRNGFQREHLLKAFEYVTDWRLAIDVGAHIGFWTVDLAMHFDKVHAFEPATDTFDCLRRNVTDYSNVELHNCAVGMAAGKCNLVDDNTRSGNTGSRFIRAGSGHTDVTPLDALELLCCDLIKIDVEGYEYQVLLGAEQLIRKHKPVIIMECKRFPNRYGGVDTHTAQLHLKSLGYTESAYMRPDKIFVAQPNQ